MTAPFGHVADQLGHHGEPTAGGDELPHRVQIRVAWRMGSPDPPHGRSERAVGHEPREHGPQRRGQHALHGKGAVRLGEEPAIEQAHRRDARCRFILVLSRQQLLGDGQPVVVGEEAIPRDLLASHERPEQICLGEDRVVESPRLRRETEPDQVERQHAVALDQRRPERGPVPGRRREAVDQQQWLALALHTKEDALTVPFEEVALGAPLVRRRAVRRLRHPRSPMLVQV